MILMSFVDQLLYWHLVAKKTSSDCTMIELCFKISVKCYQLLSWQSNWDVIQCWYRISLDTFYEALISRMIFMFHLFVFGHDIVWIDTCWRFQLSWRSPLSSALHAFIMTHFSLGLSSSYLNACSRILCFALKKPL